MKTLGAIILLAGLGLGIYAFTMSVGLEVPSKNIGFGITTPAVTIADPERVAQRKDYLMYAGILSGLGAILLVAGGLGRKQQ